MAVKIQGSVITLEAEENGVAMQVDNTHEEPPGVRHCVMPPYKSSAASLQHGEEMVKNCLSFPGSRMLKNRRFSDIL